MTQAQHDAAVKRIRDGGGTWPPTTAKMTLTPWRDTGRWKSMACRGCGAPCDGSRRWCPACCEILP